MLAVDDEESFRSVVSHTDPDLIYHPLTFLPHIRTVGIDEDLVWRGFRIWDMAGQAEYLPAHSLFMAETSAVYVVLCNVRHSDEERERQWRCWLSMIQALIPEAFQEEALESKLPAVSVIMALSHCNTEKEKDRVERARKHAKQVCFSRTVHTIHSLAPLVQVFSRYQSLLGLVHDQVFVLNYEKACTIDSLKAAIAQQASRVQHEVAEQLRANEYNLDVALRKSIEAVDDADHTAFDKPGHVIQRALDVKAKMSAIRIRFETCAMLTDATNLVNDLANAKLSNHDPPVVELSEFKAELTAQQRTSIPADLVDESAQLLFGQSLVEATIAALVGAGIIRVTDENVVLQPVQWLAKKLGVVIDKHDPQHDRQGVLDIEFLDKTCNIGAKHGHALLELLVAEGLACWTADSQTDAVLIPVMMKKATPQHFAGLQAHVNEHRPFKVGRRFKIQPADDGGIHDQLPAGFFNVLQVRLLNRFQRGELQQCADLTAVWMPMADVQFAPLLVVINHRHYFDVIAIGGDKRSTMHALRLGCGWAGVCWQSQGGLPLAKTALCVDCALQQKACDVSNVPMETVATPTDEEKCARVLLFAVQFEKELWQFSTSCFDGSDLVNILCRVNTMSVSVFCFAQQFYISNYIILSASRQIAFDSQPTLQGKLVHLECKETPQTLSTWCSTQNNNVDVAEVSILICEETPLPPSQAPLQSLTALERKQIVDAIGTNWEEVAAQFDILADAIEFLVVGGELAPHKTKATKLIEVLCNDKDYTKQQLKEAFVKAELGALLQTKLKNI